MKQSAKHAKPSPISTGPNALLRALAALALVLTSLLVALPSSASADGRIGEPGTGPGQLSNEAAGLAASAKEGGDIYVVDGDQNQRVSQFEPNGAFVRAFGWGVVNGASELQTCTTATGCQGGIEGSGAGQLDYADEIAVNNDSSSGSEYGDVYVVDQRNFRVEKFSPTGEFLLMFGGEVDKTTGANVCTAADIAGGDVCGKGLAGTGPSHFYNEPPVKDSCAEVSARISWCRVGNNSIAVGPDGTVYVGDYDRIQEFEPDGTYAGQLSLSDAEPQFVGALAVDAAGNVFERSANHSQSDLLSEIPGIREFGPAPAHAFIRTFDAGPEESGPDPNHIALDGSGDLFTAEHSAIDPNEIEFRAFKPTGTLYAEFTSDQVTPVLGGGGQVQAPAQVSGIAIEPATEKLYATSSNPNGSHIAVIDLPQAGPPQVSGERVTDVEPKTATLHAIVNPEQFDTTYRFQYITQRKYEEDANSFGVGTESTPATPADLGSVSREDKVEAALSDLTPGTAYRWRVLATNECNGPSPEPLCEAKPESTFETLPPVSIREFTTQLVAPEAVELTAELDNNNSLAKGRWKICIGEDMSYAIGCKEGELKPGSSSFEAIEATFAGLKPNTTYHYQLTAENESTQPGHPLKTEDQTLLTELSAAEERAVENCPENGTVHGEVRSTLREENHSTALPDCRAYEQVSPVDKNGSGLIRTLLSLGGTGPNQLSPSGERARFISTGAFAGTTEMASGNGNEYVASRTPSGWLTESTVSFVAGPDTLSQIWAFNAELSSWLIKVFPKPPAGLSRSEAAEMTLYRHAADGSIAPASAPLRSAEGVNEEAYSLEPIAESADLSRLFIGANYPLLATDARPYDHTSRASRIYEVSGADGPSPSLSLVAEVPVALTDFTCKLDTGDQSANWTSEDGSTFLYTQPLNLNPGEACEDERKNPQELFARIGGAPPIQLSAKSPTQCTSGHPCFSSASISASYDGVSPDGSRAWFTTAQPLIDSDTDSTSDLYLAKLQNGALTELVQASAGQANPDHPTPGAGAGVQGVLKLSPDGSHIAFVAAGVLTDKENATTQQRAVQGADNLYVYDATSEETKFVTRLCSDVQKSGVLVEPACPKPVEPINYSADRDLWSSQRTRSSQLTHDGRYLLFDSYGRLTADDTDNALDVYRYDFQTGRLIRLSFGRRGNDRNGNDDGFPAALEAGSSIQRGQLNGIAEDASRAISADGSTVVFNTAAPLVSADTNAAGTAHPGCGQLIGPNHETIVETGCDVYEWEEDGHGTCTEAGGCVSPVSGGRARQGAFNPVISSSGRDITFFTSAGLAPADTDGVPDIYDARVNGGFPFVPPRVMPCQNGSPEACHGGATHESLPINPVSESNQSGGNGPQELHCAKGKHKVKKHGQVRCVPNKKHHKHKRHQVRAARANRGGSK